MGIDNRQTHYNPGNSASIMDMDTDPTWYRGVVTDVYPNTHTMNVEVTFSSDMTKELEVPIIYRSFDPDSQARELNLLKRGVTVFVTCASGTWVVVGVAPSLSKSNPEAPFQRSITNTTGFGGKDPTYEARGESPYRGQAPSDVISGDWGVQGSEGNFIGVLEGGLTMLKGGPLSQIILSKLGDLVKVAARNFELFSDFGEVKMVNEEGKTALVINGYDNAKEANKQHENWDYSIKIGGGTNLLSMELGKTSSGDSKFSLVVDPDGNPIMKTHGRPVLEMAGAPDISVRGDQRSTYYKNNFETIKGSKTSRISGGENKDIAGMRKVLVSGSAVEHVGKNKQVCIGGPFEQRISGLGVGDLFVDGYKTSVASGNYNLDVGNPLDFGIPNPLLAGQMGNVNISTWLGDINHTINVKGDFTRSTLLGDIKETAIAGNYECVAGLAKLKLDKTGTVALGNPWIPSVSGASALEVVALVERMAEVLSMTTAAGFGAPINTVAQFALIRADATLLKGVL